MKRALSLLIATTVALNSGGSFASKIDAAATDQINASHEVATAFARKAVKEDLARTLDQMFGRLAEFSSTLELPRLYGEFLSEIEHEFVAMQSEGRGQSPPSVAGLEQFTVRFEETIRKRFLASWIPAVSENEARFARDMLKHLVEDARLTCAAGRSMRQGNFMSAGVEPPEFLSRLQAHVTPNYVGLLSGGAPVGFNYGFTSATAGSAPANRDRARLIATTTTASNVANGFYLNAQAAVLWHAIAPATNVAVAGSGGALGAISNAMVLAAPYLAGVAMAAVVAVHLMAKAEAAKLAKRFGQARDRQMRETADYEYVNRVYRETCAPYATALENVARVLEDLNGAHRAELIAAAHREDAALGDWQKEAGEDDQRQCRIDLNSLRSTYGCTDLKPNQTIAEYQPRADHPASFCVNDRPRKLTSALNGKCSIPTDEISRIQAVEAAVRDHVGYERKYSFARVIELTSAQIVLAFEDQQSLRMRLWAQNVSRIDQLQQNVQLGLERYLVTVKRANEAAQSLDSFGIARRWRMDLEVLREQLNRHSTEVVEVIFGRRDKMTLIHQLNELRDRWMLLVTASPGNAELMTLGRAVDSLIETVKEL